MEFEVIIVRLRQELTVLYYRGYFSAIMKSDPAGFYDLWGNYCMFYSAPALLNPNSDKQLEP
jgi:hypothetical protein